MRKIRSRAIRDPAATRAELLDAAEAEFNAHGFDGTDSNRIARRAGYAPQTFYRHFKDKTAVFLAGYERWWKGEAAALEKAGGGGNAPPNALEAAKIALHFHVKWRGFRRSLRHLAIVDADIRAARTTARLEQIARLRMNSQCRDRTDAELIAALLSAERLCDAAAEGELADLGLSQKKTFELVAAAMAKLFIEPS